MIYRYTCDSGITCQYELYMTCSEHGVYTVKRFKNHSLDCTSVQRHLPVNVLSSLLVSNGLVSRDVNKAPSFATVNQLGRCNGGLSISVGSVSKACKVKTVFGRSDIE